jgi:hypothetical protein
MNDREKKPTRNKKGDSLTLSEVGEEITVLYQNTRNGTELAAALQARNYKLIRSTRRKLLVIDRKGVEHDLIFSVAAPREEVEKKLADIDPATLPLKKSRERDFFVKCFVSLGEKAEIEARAEQEELSVSGFIRTLIFGKDTPQPKGSRRPPAQKQALVKLYAELNQVGNNIKKIEQHTQERFFESRTTDSYKTKYNALLDAINVALTRRLTKQSPRDKEKLVNLNTELIRIGDSINQVAKQLNQGQDFDSEFFLKIYTELDAVLTTLTNALNGGEK